MKLGKYELIGKALLIKKGKEKVLAIADLHLGYQESAVAGGILIPGSVFNEFKEEIEALLKKVGRVSKIIIVGDLKHEFGRVMRSEWSEITSLFEILEKQCGEVIIVKGNHDKIIGPVAEKRKIKVVDYYIWKGWCFLHGDRDFPEIHNKGIEYWVMGHVHPAVTLKEGIKSEKYKCFLIGKHERKEVVILPSFFSMNEGTDPRIFEFDMPWEMKIGSFEVYIIGEQLEVLNFGKLGKI